MATITKYTPEINTLLNQVSTTASDVVTLDGRLDTAETSIVTLDGRLDLAEASIADLNDQSANNIHSPFLPSTIYDSTKSATTTVLGQSEGRATGAKVLRAENLSTTNACFIGLGQSNSEAEYNASNGTNNVNRFKLPVLSDACYINITNYLFYSWLGSGATVSVHLVQGV